MADQKDGGLIARWTENAVLGFIVGPVLLVTLAAFLEMYMELSSQGLDRPGGS